MYTFSSAVLTVLYIALAISIFFITSAKWAKINKYLSLVLCGVGVVLTVASVISVICKLKAFSDTDPTGTKSEWAKSVFFGTLGDVIPVFAILAVLILLSVFVQPQKRFVRVFLIAFSAIGSLVYGYVSSFITENEKGSVTVEIKLFCTALSLILISSLFFDFKNLFKKLYSKN